MPITVIDGGGTPRIIKRIRLMDGGNLRTIKTVKVKDETGTVRTVYSTFSVSINEPAITSFGFSDPIVSSPSSIVTPNGGSPPYTYSWSTVYTTIGSVSITNPTSNTTQFVASGIPASASSETLARCTVTDSTSAPASVDVLLTFININFS